MYFYSSSLQKARKSAWDSSRYLYGILCFIRFVILSVAAAEAEQHPLLPPRCSVPTLSEVFSPSQDICPVTLHKPPACLHEALANIGVGAPRVAEVWCLLALYPCSRAIPLISLWVFENSGRYTSWMEDEGHPACMFYSWYRPSGSVRFLVVSPTVLSVCRMGLCCVVVSRSP